jgi:hypothetical protein
VREVTKVQGNGYWFPGPDGKRRWGSFPKASELEFDGTTAIVKLADGDRFWSLRVEPETPGIPSSDKSASPVSGSTPDTLTTPLTT